MSISADATCRGLRNARDGQIALQLSRGEYSPHWRSDGVRLFHVMEYTDRLHTAQ